MPETVAVLGVGAVGGVIAARTGALCIATERTANAVAQSGIVVETPGGVVHRDVPVVGVLDRPVRLLVIATKATTLDNALARVDRSMLGEAVILPLLNGLEHVERLRVWVGGAGATVAAGSIGNFQAYVREPGRVVQLSDGALVTAASDTLAPGELRAALAPLDGPGLTLAFGVSEAAVLWEKAVRLGVLAAATIASGVGVGALRTDPLWRDRLRSALDEASVAAGAHGVPIDADAQWAFVESLETDLTTSAARDVAAGRPSELDAITGAVVRAAEAAGVPVPVLRGLLDDAQAATS